MHTTKHQGLSNMAYFDACVQHVVDNEKWIPTTTDLRAHELDNAYNELMAARVTTYSDEYLEYAINRRISSSIWNLN